MGSLFGYKAMVNIPEGTATDTVYTRGDKPIKLDFQLKLEKFSVSFYETGAPKEFKSMLTVLDNGKPVEGLTNRATIVNDPLSYKGITFYQSSYGMASEGGVYHFLIKQRKGGELVKVVARQGEQVALPGGGFFRVLEATQDVRQVLPQFSGPAARVEVIPSAGAQPQAPFIVLKNNPEMDELRGGQQVFVYEGADDKFFTGLQVAKDPGVWVVWFGCALMVIGISMAFFMSHTRVWIRVVNGRVVFGGTASKNPAAFQMRFEAMADKLKAL
jgi:cytochrome c biogenesis protein